MSSCRAFICYMRSDEAAAAKLRRALSRLTIPSAPSSAPSIGPIHSKRLDQAPLDRATRFDIEASDHLILLCSPAAMSQAMDDAAMIFKAQGWSHRIVPVLTAGEPWASRTPGLEHLECLPHAMRFAIDAEGALTDHPVTPPSVDFRRDGLPVDRVAAHVVARLTGAPAATFIDRAQRRRRRRGFAAGLAAAAAVTAIALAPTLIRDVRTNSAVAAARDAGLAAHEALDAGRRDEAVAALTKAFPRDFTFSAPPFPAPNEALTALSRAALETRVLADIAAPPMHITGFATPPEGALVALGPDAGAHLMDTGADAAMRVYRPRPNAYSRVAPDGATLWIARFEAEARNEEGDLYAPLVFENVDLTTGDVLLSTAVQSLPPAGGEAAISPDGARFAVDIGPGQTDRTLIAVFNREEQSLAGVTTLPADRAGVTFLSPDRLLLTTNPPNIFGEAPGLYLWRLDEDTPRVLRAPGRLPICPGAGAAPRRAIAAELASGRLTSADWAVSGDGDEITLLLPSLGGGSCLLRWDGQTGRVKSPIVLSTTFESLAFVTADGPYAARAASGDLALVDGRGETPMPGCSGATHHFADGGDPVILCEGADETVLHHGYSGQRLWRGPALPPLTAAAYDPLSQRLYMARNDGRIAIWDAAERGYQIASTFDPVTLARADADHIAVLADGAPPAFFDPVGRWAQTVDPALIARVRPSEAPEILALAATGPSAPEETCEALAASDVIHRSDSPSGQRSAIETDAGLAVYDRETCLPLLRLTTRTVGSGPLMVSDDLLWAPLPGEVAVFPVTAPVEEALESLHARAVWRRQGQ